MLKVLVRPFGVLTKVFHPGVCDTIKENQAGLNHFKAKTRAAINTVPCPSTFGKSAEISAEGHDAIKEKDTTFNQMSDTA